MNDAVVKTGPRRAFRRALVALFVAFPVLTSIVPPTGVKGAERRTVTYHVDPSTTAARTVPLIMGVGTHFGIGGDYGYDPQKSADAIASLGLDSFRDDFSWGAFKAGGLTQPGQLPPKLEGFMRLTRARPLLILDFPNPQVEGGKAPLTAQGQSAFAQFAVQASAALASYRPMYEMWNEWNLTAAHGQPRMQGEGDASDPRAAAHYAPLAIASSGALRRADPGTTILVGAAGVDPGWPWVKSIVGRNALQSANGLSVHLYNHCEPDVTHRTAEEAIDNVEQLQRSLIARGRGATPIYVTEFGWPTASSGGCVITRDASANNIAQFMLWAAATPWMKGVWVYQLKDQGRQLGNIEDNFGLFDYDYRPKPSACLVKDALTLVKSARSWRMDRPLNGLFLAQAQTARGPRLIAWTARQDIHASLSVPRGAQWSWRTLCTKDSTPASGTIAIGPRPVVIDTSGSGPADVMVSLQ